ncbi:DUF5667 domain-containing protein [Chloroflexota bacterium]
MKRVEDILTQCIEEIKSGKVNLAECLDHYPAIREELEPLLRIALSINEPPDVMPSDAFKIRARVNLMEYIHASKTTKKPVGSSLKSLTTRAWATGWSRAVVVILAVIISVSALGTGTVYASQDSVPGDILYPVKLGTEQAQRFFTTNDVSGTSLELSFADNRIEEMVVLTHKRPEELAVAVNGYERNLELTISRVEQVNNKGVRASLQETIALAISGHLFSLDELEDSMTEKIEEINTAREIAMDGHIRALQGLMVENPLRAAEINIVTMLDRLNRAKLESERGNIKEMEQALQHFQRLRKFGEEISSNAAQNGYDTRAIDELNAGATAGQMEIFGAIYSNTPEEAKGIVEKAMVVSMEGHGQAVQGLQQQGSLGDIPEEPPLPEDIPGEVKKKILKPETAGEGNGRN